MATAPASESEAQSLASLSEAERNRIINSLSKEEAQCLLYDWEFWARPDQLPPAGNWFCWLLRSGRGAGKTRTGAEWVISRARQKAHPPIALVGQTKADVRDTMIELGESSILKVSPPWFTPIYEPSKRRLTWPNGVVAIAYSGDEPDQLRGPQHGAAWIDELAKMRYPQATWDNMELGLRLGDNPQVVVTTTPRPIPIIKQLITDPDTIDRVASTYANIANLSPSYIKRVIRKYEGTHLGRQELHGQLMDDDPRALWSRELLERTRVTRPPDLHRIVVAVDPPAGSGQAGIVVAGIATVSGETHGYTLEDASTPEGVKPAVWGSAAVAAYHKWGADMIVGEVNNGGDMIEDVIRNVPDGRNVAYKTVRATRGKYTRAEPVSNLFEQDRAHHVGQFADLEDQLCTWIPGQDSPDRLDAEVWVYTELMLDEVEDPPAGETVNVDEEVYRTERERNRLWR
jgi:phage terminase large subunit-like protein